MQTTTTAARPMLEVQAQHIAALRRVINPSAYRRLSAGHPELLGVSVTPADREYALERLLEDAERVGLWIGGERDDWSERQASALGPISCFELIALGLSGKADPEQCAAIWAELGARFQRDHNGELEKSALEVAEVSAGVR